LQELDCAIEATVEARYEREDSGGLCLKDFARER
jgi:hypothetical protein